MFNHSINLKSQSSDLCVREAKMKKLYKAVIACYLILNIGKGTSKIVPLHDKQIFNE